MSPLATSELGPVIARPSITTIVKFDDMGYAGWAAKLLLNPKSADYDKLFSQELPTEWEGIGSVIIDWNFGDESGNKIPLPKDCKREDCDVPLAVMRRLMDMFHEAFRESLTLPKVSGSNSDDTSSTNNGQVNPEQA
jgi:hypothetical protein